MIINLYMEKVGSLPTKIVVIININKNDSI